jgi:hypothetical protein
MSILRSGDEHLHYCDGSHRWVSEPQIEQHVWEATLHAHVSQHLLTMGGYDRSRNQPTCNSSNSSGTRR